MHSQLSARRREESRFGRTVINIRCLTRVLLAWLDAPCRLRHRRMSERRAADGDEVSTAMETARARQEAALGGRTVRCAVLEAARNPSLAEVAARPRLEDEGE